MAIERLSDSAAQVLRVLITGNQLSRPELSEHLGVTAPTITTAVVELMAAGFVGKTGSRQGKFGRAAALYTLSARSGWLLGIDLGSTQIQLAARSLDGANLGDFRYSALETDVSADAIPPSLIHVAAERIQSFIAEFSTTNGPLRSVGIALARVVPHSPTTESVIGFGADAVRFGHILDELGLPPEVPALLENNVNCAALAEMTLGSGQEADNFAYLQIGVRVGAAIVVDGKLRRGAHGGSGELSALPFPLGPAGEGAQPESGATAFTLERYLGSDSLLERVRASWNNTDAVPPSTSRELIELAARGEQPALRIVHEHATDISRVAMVVSAVVDPELIVLGGGVGQNPILARMIEELLQQERPGIRIETSALGDRSTVEGAAALAIEHARSLLLGGHYESRLGGHGRTVVHVADRELAAQGSR